jgi:hypothetical protein
MDRRSFIHIGGLAAGAALWDLPRSGTDGAAYLGVELRGYSVDDGLLDLGFGSAPVADERERRLVVVKFAP